MLHLKLNMSHYTEAQSTLDVGVRVRVTDFFGLDGATNVERLKNYDVLSL